MPDTLSERKRTDGEKGGVGVQTPLMVSHSLPSAKHRINAGLLQSHNGKSNSIIPSLLPTPPTSYLCALMGIQTPSQPRTAVFAPALSEPFMNHWRPLNCH